MTGEAMAERPDDIRIRDLAHPELGEAQRAVLAATAGITPSFDEAVILGQRLWVA